MRYDHYELKTAEDGKRYITPGKSAKPDVYNPLKEAPNIVLDALNVGMLMMGRKPEAFPLLGRFKGWVQGVWALRNVPVARFSPKAIQA